MPLRRGNPSGDLRLLLFDAFHDSFRGVVCLVEVVDGTLRSGDRLTASSTGANYDVAEVCSRSRNIPQKECTKTLPLKCHLHKAAQKPVSLYFHFTCMFGRGAMDK